MIGEFLIFDIVVLIGAILINWKYKLGLFSKKNKRNLFIVTILGFFIVETIAIFGYVRNWWTVNNLIGIQLPPLYLEDSFLYAILPFVIIALWESYSKIIKKKI